MSNHLDADARGMLLAALTQFGGTGLLVSHDRELLDALCDRCLFLRDGEAVLRPGGYTDGKEQQEREEQHARDQFILARRELRRLEHEVASRRDLAHRSHHMLSKWRSQIGTLTARCSLYHAMLDLTL